MRDLFGDAEHLFRLAGVFVALFVAFLVVRAALIPKSFGEYGHYRAAALGEARERGVVFAGRAACLECHEDVGTTKAGGKHAGVGCEACHGPLTAHVADPATVVPQKPDPAAVCLVCHLQNLAKPKGFPQIEPKDHYGDACGACHKPHSPLPVAE